MCVNTSVLPSPGQGTQGRAEVWATAGWLAGRQAHWSEQATSLLSLLSPLQLPWGVGVGAQNHVGPAPPGPDWGLTLLLLTLLAFLPGTQGCWLG